MWKLSAFFAHSVESKTWTYHGQVGSGHMAEWRGWVGQDWTPTELFALETSLPRTLQSIEDTSPRLSRSTNKRQPNYKNNYSLLHLQATRQMFAEL